jgi:Flp pilus assembly protein TadG
MMKTTRVRAHGDGGAALVEFAFVIPILFLLIFGVMEFGWAFSQHMDVRHGARETARLAAVDYGTGTGTAHSDVIIQEGCDRMDEFGDTTIELQNDGSASGSRIEVTVERPLDTLTGFLDFAIGGIDLRSHVETRAEQQLTWADRTPQLCT